jgi:hypothetical protein
LSSVIMDFEAGGDMLAINAYRAKKM